MAAHTNWTVAVVSQSLESILAGIARVISRIESTLVPAPADSGGVSPFEAVARLHGAPKNS